MKNLIFCFCIALFLGSCSINDDEPNNVSYPLAPIESVDVPDSLISGREYKIGLTYLLPSECHKFNGIIAEEAEDTLFIGVQTIVNSDKQNCGAGMPGETSFQLLAPLQEEFFIFKFWTGEDAEGEGIYLEVKVPVVPEASVET